MIRFLIIALVSFATLGACQESRGASAPAKVVITNSAVNARVAPLWIARDQGFYKKYGIETDMVLIRSGPLQVASLASGDSDVGYSGASTALGAAAGGADLKILAAFTNKVTYDLVARPGIKSAADLRGKRVGVQAIGGTVWMGAILGLEQLGLEPGRDRINIMVIGDQAVASQGLVAGVIMSLLQIVTSIQDTAFSTVPRLVAFLVGLILLLPWMLMKMMAFTIAILGDLARFAR
jgi:ABC-type nitrate/sulfonate/bicarbonate transport system substrate-binding protein